MRSLTAARRGTGLCQQLTFDPERYKERGTAERCIGKLRQSRAMAARYGERERIFQGSADIASIRICPRGRFMIYATRPGTFGPN